MVKASFGDQGDCKFSGYILSSLCLHILSLAFGSIED
jgi:hypothetical protein